ncbi:TPA: hypothetical protein ACGO2O_000439 [Streptococcus suis]
MTYEQLATLALSTETTFEISLKNIQREPKRMAVASYSNGTFGKRWRVAINKIMSVYNIRIDLNNQDYTAIGLEITDQLEKLGYSYKNNFTEFTK